MQEYRYEGFRLPSLANRRYAHWRQRHREMAAQRGTVYWWLVAARFRWETTLPCTITLIRQAPRALGQGNVEMCFKAVQDAVADVLSGEYLKGNDDMPGLTWRYAQQPGPPALIVQVQPATIPPA